MPARQPTPAEALAAAVERARLAREAMAAASATLKAETQPAQPETKLND